MFKIDTTDLQRVVTAIVGALVLSTACVGAAVAPARAVETAPLQIAAHQAQLSGEARA